MTRSKSNGIRREQVRQQLDQMQSDAHNFVGRNNSTPSRNPTAGGGSGREWENHKYIDKVQTKTGKTRYIYDIDTASGRHDGSAKRIGAEELGRAGESLGKAKTALTATTSPRANLAAAQLKSTSRNTGGGNKVHSPLEEVSRTARNVMRDVSKAVESASKAVSDGANYVSKMMSDAVANTPLKDLFK